MQLTLRKHDFYLNFVPGLKYWDFCASEALIYASLGVATNSKQKTINYDVRNEAEYTINNGFVVANSPHVYKLCITRIEDHYQRPLF